MKICFETFGCRLNRAEALDDEAKCLAKGHHIVTSHADADLIIVRGCSVTEKAQRDCEKLISHLRRKYPRKQLVVTGCLKEARDFNIDGGKDAVPTRTCRAYLKVQDGCDCACTFCIVPQFRGRSVSTPFDSVVDRAKRFIDAGYHEIVVTGCNLSLYASGSRRLADLAAALAELDAGCRVRIGSVEPGRAALDLVDAMAERPNICRFLHVPVQSGSDRLLIAMKRPYRVRHVEELFLAARKQLGDVLLGADMISGFPGETNLDHMTSQQLLRRHEVVNVHAFPFSERPGTPAAKLKNAVPPPLRSQRAKALAATGDLARREFAKRFVGREVDIVVENEKTAGGWTGEYLWFERAPHAGEGAAAAEVRRRQLVRVRVVEATKHGRLLGAPV